MSECRGSTGLDKEPFPQFRRAASVELGDLQRHGSLQVLVGCQVDDSHGTLTNDPFDEVLAEAAGQWCMGRGAIEAGLELGLLSVSRIGQRGTVTGCEVSGDGVFVLNRVNRPYALPPAIQ